jgi:hypothetical protein
MPTLYDHSTTPPGAQFLDGSPGIKVCHTVNFDGADGEDVGQVTELWWYCGAQNGGTWTLVAWTPTASDSGDGGAGNNFVSKAFVGTPVANAWNKVVLDAPINVKGGSYRLRHGVHNGQYYWVNNGHFSGHDDSANGINALRSGDTSSGLGPINQGTFCVNSSPSAYPNLTGSQAFYGVDVTFVPSAVTPPEVHTTTGTAPATATASATARKVGISAGTAQAIGATAATNSSSRPTAGAAPATATASATTRSTRATSGTAPAAATVLASTRTTRVTAGTAVAVATAGSYSAQGAPGPWLVSRSSRDRRIVTRGRVAN